LSKHKIAVLKVASSTGSGIAWRLAGSENSGKCANSACRPFSYSLPELAAEVAEAGEGLRRIPFLAHEEQRNLGQ
jgi:hypothetical protein